MTSPIVVRPQTTIVQVSSNSAIVKSPIVETQTIAAIDQTTVLKPIVETQTVQAGIQGQAGRNGSDSTATPIIYSTATALSALRVLRLNELEQLEYASCDDPTEAFNIAGFLSIAVGSGVLATVDQRGIFSDSSWSWTPKRPLYLGLNGFLTETPPQSGFLIQLATTITAQKITFEIQDATLL
ncbi:MAG: hypothetical protein KME15_19860 [Drouetiella hepatica Uher 2000/2452]|jgi:hypothetical protein|uniref:Uncharacterized protein n=1 Tax=Drouetiella hepatica Uher 2000/2452 TaxID=904376 RepID=A0A951UNX7_9CYAN|nr:hypothetical protein [Drouetiella hepatica Uher 2000/2452]